MGGFDVIYIIYIKWKSTVYIIVNVIGALRKNQSKNQVTLFVKYSSKNMYSKQNVMCAGF